MSGTGTYYLSRLVVTAFLVALLLYLGSPWYLAGLLGVLAAAFFFWAPRGGRYAPARDPMTAGLQRDEWGQVIAHRSARNGFVVMIVALGAGVLWFGLIAPSAVPIDVLALIGALGVLTYFVSDVWLRRS